MNAIREAEALDPIRQLGKRSIYQRVGITSGLLVIHPVEVKYASEAALGRWQEKDGRERPHPIRCADSCATGKVARA